MNKHDLASKVAARTGLPQSQARTVVDAVVEEISASLAAGEVISLSGFGKFSVADRAARTGRNPLTGEPIEIKAARLPKFSASSNLKQQVNG